MDDNWGNYPHQKQLAQVSGTISTVRGVPVATSLGPWDPKSMVGPIAKTENVDLPSGELT